MAVRFPLALAAVGAGLALAWPGGAVADGPRNREYVDTFTTSTPGSGSGRLIRTDISNPDDPNGKAPAQRRIVVELHRGALFDTAAVPRCGATDAELMARGVSACPGGSILGTGETHFDTGFSGPARFAIFDDTMINARNEIVFLARSRDDGAQVVVRGRVARNTWTIDVPPLPGAPPDGSAGTREILNLRNASSVVGGRRRHYLTTPPICPPSGFWTNRVTYTFGDGVVQSFTAKSPCLSRAQARRRARARVRFFLRRSRSARVFNRRRRLLVSLRVSRGALRKVRIRLRRGRRTYASTRRSRLRGRARIRVRKRRSVRRGRYRLVLTGRDDTGRRVRASARVRFGP